MRDGRPSVQNLHLDILNKRAFWAKITRSSGAGAALDMTLASFALFILAVVMMIYGVAKPQMDYSDAFKEPSDGPNYRGELEKSRASAEKYQRENAWKSYLILAISILLLFCGIIVRG
jgi:hypothetical protein